MLKICLYFSAVLGFFSFFIQSVQAATGLPSGFSETTHISGLDQPVALEFAPDGRLFILEKTGKVRIYKNGQLLATPFAQIAVDAYFEQGLLGITFDPNFATNRYVYFFYSLVDYNRVSRFRASSSNPDIVEAGSETVILDNIPNPGGYHNGGDIHFGPDGKLYASAGDGGQTREKAQDLSSLNGKILRINSDGSIPTDNPFFNQAGARKEVWTYGLRNPWRFSFDSQTGKMYIGEVGEWTWEEINEGVAGRNYGWPTCEGTCSNSGFTNALHVYNHSVGTSVTGGLVYRGTQFPTQYRGQYFFADYGSNWIKTMNPSTNAVSNFASNTLRPVDFEVGPDGSLFYASVDEGKVFRISYASGATPTPSPSPSPSPTPLNTAPTVSISTPVINSKYSAGDTIQYSAQGSDAEDGILPNSAFSWTIQFHHDTHTHPFLGPITNQKSGSFLVPRLGELASTVWYRISVTVTDSKGAQTTVFRDIQPNVVNLTFRTIPAGLQIALDGQPRTDGYMVPGVVGITRSINAQGEQTLNGKNYVFSSWSDSGAVSHTFDTPTQNTTYTATFVETATTACDADFNSDNFIDISDYSLLVNDFLKPTPSNPATDINADGITDISDYSLLVSFFFETCTP